MTRAKPLLWWISARMILPTNLLRFNLISLEWLLRIVLTCLTGSFGFFELVDQANLVLYPLSLHPDLAILHELMGTRPAHRTFLYLELVFFKNWALFNVEGSIKVFVFPVIDKNYFLLILQMLPQILLLEYPLIDLTLEALNRHLLSLGFARTFLVKKQRITTQDAFPAPWRFHHQLLWSLSEFRHLLLFTICVVFLFILFP